MFQATSSRIILFLFIYNIIYQAISANVLNRLDKLDLSQKRPGFKRQTQNENDLDFTFLNQILDSVNVVVPTDVIADSNFKQNIAGFDVEFKIQIGGASGNVPGECKDFSLDGQFRVIGEELEPLDGLDREKFTIIGEGLKLTCDIPMRVKIDRITGAGGFVDIPLGGIQDSQEGEMIIKLTEGLKWTQSFTVTSPDFTKFAPTAVVADDCEIVLGEIFVDAQEVLALFDNIAIFGGGGINLDGQIEDQLNDDASLLTAPVQENVCVLSNDLAITLGELLSQNPFTNIGPDSPLTGGGFFDTDGDGVLDAVEREAELIANISTNTTLNLQRGNFLIDILFPEGGENEENLLEQFFDSFNLDGVIVQQNDAVGLVIALLNSRFNLTLDETITDLDLVPLIKAIVDATDGNQELFEGEGDDLIMVFVDDFFEVGFANISIRLIATELLLSENGGTNTDTGIFTGMDIFSNFSVILPNFDLGDYFGSAQLELDLRFEFDPSGTNLTNFFADEPINITFPKEILSVDVSIESLLAKAAGLIAIDEAILDELQIGPILEDALNCITSTLAAPAVITAFGADVDRIDASIFGFQDAITNLVGDVLNSIIFSYQSVILRALETLLAQQLLDPPVEVLEVGNCTTLDENATNIVDKFDFSQEIFQTLFETADAEFFESLIGFIVSSDGEVVLDIIEPDDPVQFGLALFSAGGFEQQVNFTISSVKVLGVSPPKVNSGSLDLPTNNPLFPQALVAEVDFLTNEQRLQFQVDMKIVINEPTPDPDNPAPEGAVPPSIFDNTNSTNDVSISLELQNVVAFVELLATLTKFDVEGTKIIDIAKTDCWVSKLASPGGFSDRLQVDVLLAEMQMECDCGSPILTSVAEVISNVNGFEELNFDLQQLVNLIVGSFSTKFTEDFDFTIDNAKRTCNGEEENAREFNIDPKGEKDPAAFAFIAILAATLMFTLPFVLASGFEKRYKKTQATQILETPSIKKQEPTEEEKEAMLAGFAAFEENNGNKGENVPMYKNEHIPKGCRFMVGFLLFLNFLLFIYGDFGVSLEIELRGNLLESPLPPQDFGSFSVVTSTIDLYESGAVGLAILIFVVALFWPYFKTISLCVCFFSGTSCLGLKFRGQFIHFLDVFGKWSIVEVFFVVFLRLLFELSLNSPQTQYLPDINIYLIELLITPQLSFYTFGTAVLISIFISNVLMVYHEKIVRKNQDDLRNIVQIKEVNQSVFIKMNMADYLFYTNKRQLDGSPNYAYKFTSLGKKAFVLFTFLCMVLTIAANALFIAKVRYLGLTRIFLDLAGEENEPAFSVFSIAGSVFSGGAEEGDFGAMYFATVILLVNLVAPLLVLTSTLYILFKGMTLTDARKHQVLRSALAAWTTLEVFILSIAVAVIEVPAVAKALTSDSCDFFFEFMSETLLPLGLVTEEDVENTCFGMQVEIPVGGYLYLIAILFNLLNAALVLKMFGNMIKQRKSGEKNTQHYVEEEALDDVARLDRNLEGGPEKVNFSRTILIFKKLRLIVAYRKDEPVST